MNLAFNLRNVGILGRNLYVGTPEHYSTIDTDDIVEYAAKAANVTKASMFSTFIALYDAFEYYLCNGHSFKLDGLGTFSLSLSAVTTDPTAADTISGADAVNSVGINFLADKSIKSMLNGISWNCYVNQSSLAEFTDFVARRVVLGSDSCNLLRHDSSEAHSLNVGDVIKLAGWNCPSQTTVKVEGLNASGAAASEVFTLKIAGKKNAIAMVADAKATVAIPTVQKITVNGVVYDYSGTQKTVSAAAGSHAIFEGASFINGSYVIAFSGSDLTDLVAKLDGTTLSFASKTATSAKTPATTLATGSHVLTINGEDINFTCTDTPVASVNALSANGVSVSNGGTSSMRSGVSYAFVATGQNLNLLSQSDITLPSGSTMSGFTVSTDGTRLQFSVVYGGNEGALSIGSYFTVNVKTTSTSESDVTSVQGIADGGTFNWSGQTPLALTVVGTGLDQVTFKLTNSSTGADLTSSTSWNPETGSFVISSEISTQCKLVAYNASGESIYTASGNVNTYSVLS